MERIKFIKVKRSQWCSFSWRCNISDSCFWAFRITLIKFNSNRQLLYLCKKLQNLISKDFGNFLRVPKLWLYEEFFILPLNVYLIKLLKLKATLKLRMMKLYLKQHKNKNEKYKHKNKNKKRSIWWNHKHCKISCFWDPSSHQWLLQWLMSLARRRYFKVLGGKVRKYLTVKGIIGENKNRGCRYGEGTLITLIVMQYW